MLEAERQQIINQINLSKERINLCPGEICDLGNQFVQKVIDVLGECNDYSIAKLIEYVGEAGVYVMQTSKLFSQLNDKDVKNFKKIFDELELLLLEVIKNEKSKILKKVVTIREITRKNFLFLDQLPIGMIFGSISNLWKAVKFVNRENEKNEFSIQDFYDFAGNMKTEMLLGIDRDPDKRFAEFVAIF